MLLYNESQHDEMLSILKAMQEYCPQNTTNDSQELKFHSLLLGGDQFSSSMARRVIADRKNSTNEEESLKGICPVNEDWHSKLCFLTVSQ